MKYLAGICSPSLTAGQQQRNPVPQQPWCAWPSQGTCHHPGDTAWQWALQGPSVPRTQLGTPGCSAKLRPAPARFPREFCSAHITAGCFSQISQRGGSYPNRAMEQPCPLLPLGIAGSCSHPCHQGCTGTSQNRLSCPDPKVHPHLTPHRSLKDHADLPEHREPPHQPTQAPHGRGAIRKTRPTNAPGKLGNLQGAHCSSRILNFTGRRRRGKLRAASGTQSWCQATCRVHGTKIAHPGCPSSRGDTSEDSGIARPRERPQSLPIPTSLSLSLAPTVSPGFAPRCFLSCFSKAPKRCGEDRGCRHLHSTQGAREEAAPDNSGSREQKESSKLVSRFSRWQFHFPPAPTVQGTRGSTAAAAGYRHRESPGSRKSHSRACSKGDSDPWGFSGIFELIFSISHLLPPTESSPAPHATSTPLEPVPPVSGRS